MWPFKVVRPPDGPSVGVQASPDGPVRYFHKDHLKPCPAPVPEPIWLAVPGPREESLMASTVSPHTLWEPPEENLILENDPIRGDTPVAVQKPAPIRDGGHSKSQSRSGLTIMSPPSRPRVPSTRVKSQSGKRTDVPVDPLDRGNPRHLDYHGFGFHLSADFTWG